MPFLKRDLIRGNDRDLRIQFSMILLAYVIPFALGWWITAYFLGATLLSVAAAIAMFGLLAGLFLHYVEWHLTARIVWLAGVNAGIALATFVTPPEGHISFMFVAIATGPFVLFSARRSLGWLVGMVFLPVFLWYLSWATDYALLGEFEVTPEAADRVLAPATALTVFATVLFVIGYFVRRANLQADWLLEAQRQAERSSEAKSTLMRSVSHEMLTPLHAISGFAEFLNSDAKARREIPADTLESYSGQILSSSNALLLIIENIFDFANWTAEDATAETSKVPVLSCLQTVIGRFGSALENKDVSVNNQVDPDLRVEANPVWLASIFKQLLDNAIKFSKPGGVIVVEARSVGDGRVEIMFTDTGPGFPKGAAGTAFVPFDKLGHETGTTSGVGVGLTLAQNFAEAMGGRIEIDDGVTEGARVKVVMTEALGES